ncbi:MAG TPA: RNA methyltransferase [Saprospiraceae bacterium]|nr:RNA methyltransferase [Saprospiraceae bacterium]HMP23095.1 RNA methyltransferase [Saprospiraceae bacterium]
MRKRSLSELNRLSVAEFKTRPKTPIVLVLDNVRSALNVGSAFRTADAFAIERIFLCGITAQPPNKEINKTALGATETVAWTYNSDPAEVVKKLQSDGYQVLAAEQAEGSIQLQDFVPLRSEKYALVFGNEVNGVSESVMDLVNNCIEIPQFGTKHSLNISVCVGIVVWELFIKILNAK